MTQPTDEPVRPDVEDERVPLTDDRFDGDTGLEDEAPEDETDFA